MTRLWNYAPAAALAAGLALAVIALATQVALPTFGSI